MQTSKLSMTAAAAAMMLVTAGCGPKQDADGYGATARDHFVDSCTTERTVEGDELTVESLAPEQACLCVYDNIRTDNADAKFPLEWEDLRTYEKRVEDADATDLPAPPAQLTDAIELCQTAGPVPATDSSE